MEQKLKNTESTLTDVIETLHDSHKGFADIGEHLKDATAKRFFLEESLTRQQWGDLKAKLGGGDQSLLETAEAGEDEAKKAYEKALQEKGIPADLQQILRKQQAHVIASHDKVKALRDAKKAAA